MLSIQSCLVSPRVFGARVENKKRQHSYQLRVCLQGWSHLYLGHWALRTIRVSQHHQGSQVSFSSEFKSYYWRKKKKKKSFLPLPLALPGWRVPEPEKCIYSLSCPPSKRKSCNSAKFSAELASGNKHQARGNHRRACMCVRVYTLFPSSPLLQIIHQPNTHFLKQNPRPSSPSYPVHEARA